MKDTDKRERLMLLSGLKDLRVSKGDPDIRGWEVVTADKKMVGKVHELVIDTIDMMVRYLDIDVDGKILDVKGGSHLLIPIAGAQLDDDDNRVYLTEITVEELRALPPYDHRRITRDFETNIASWFDRTRGRTAPAAATATTSAPPPHAEDRPIDSPRVDPPVAPTATAPPPADETDDPFYKKEHFSDRDFWGQRRKGREDSSYVTPEEPGDEK